MKWTNFFATIALGATILLSGCGDLKKNDVVAQELENSQLKLECELDINAFKHILEKNISGAIGCLDSTLNLFMRVVPSEKPETLSLDALKRFLARYRTDIKPEDMKMISAVFDISRLLFGGEPGFISRSSKNKIISLATIFNREASKNFELFRCDKVANPGCDKIKVPYLVHRQQQERISVSTSIIAKELRDIFNPNRNGEVHRLDIIQLLENFSTAESRDSIEKAKKLLFAKRVLVGGYNEEITHEEFYRLIYNMPKMILFTFDLVRFKNIDIDQKSLFDLFSNDLTYIDEVVFSNVLGNRSEETLFELDHLIQGLSALLKPEDFDPLVYSPLIYEVKQLLMGGGQELVKGKDLKNLIAHGREVITRGQVFHQIYEHYNNILLNRSQVDIPVRDIVLHFPNFKREHIEDFSRIVSKYRFLKGSFDAPYYSNNFIRNAAGVGEIGMYEYIIKIAAKAYGKPTAGALGGYSFDLETITTLMGKFENFLIDADLVLPGRYAKTAETITLMGSLFQYQSDRNGMLDVNELTEFAISLFSGGAVGDKINDDLAAVCEADKYGRIDPVCYKENFYKALCRTSSAYFPRLAEWAQIDVKKCDDYVVGEQAMTYLTRAIQAARTCNNYSDGDKEEIPFSKGDSTTILTAMMNIESTMSRYDVNLNNIMDKDEVQTSYQTYEPAIEGIVNKMSGIARTLALRLKREIFMFLIKFEKSPETMELLKFVAIDFKKRQPATRKTIASILVTIGEQSSEPETFQCKWMRTPDHIPRNQEERDQWTPDIADRLAPNKERPAAQ
jgi:hypothetical protein